MLGSPASRGLFAALLTFAGFTPLSAQPSTCVPELIGADRRGPAQAISRSGNTLYLGAGAAVTVVDTTDLLNPVERGYVNLDELVLDVAHWQTTAVALGEHGLAFIDASNPEQPEVVGTFPFPAGWVVGTATARDGIVYVPEANGLHVLDASDPTAPVEIGAFPAATTRDVVLNGNRAYLLAGSLIRVLSVANPAAPTQVASVPVPGEARKRFSIAGNGSRLATSGCVTDSHILWCDIAFYSLADPDLPAYRSAIGFDGSLSVRVSLAWGRAYVNRSIYDLSQLSNPTYLGTLPQFGPRAHAGSPDPDYLFVADPWLGLHVVDVSDPTDAQIAATIGLPTQVIDGYVAGSVAVVAHQFGLRTFDLSDATRPTVLGSLALPGSWFTDIVRVGDHAYLTDRSGSSPHFLQLIDLGDPSDPLPGGALPSQFSARAVVDDEVLILRQECESIALYDVADPAIPLQVSQIPLGDTCPSTALAADGRRLYVWAPAGPDPGDPLRLVTFDLTDPALPVELASGWVPSHGGDSWANGRYLYLYESNRLSVMSVHDPNQPTIVGNLVLPQVGSSRRISGYGARLTLASGSETGEYERPVHYIDVSDPHAPVEVATLATVGYALGAFAGPGFIVVADGPAGISIYSSCVPFADGFESGDTAEWSDTQP